jgi:hypothetical protein
MTRAQGGALARDYLTAYGPERTAFVVRYAMKAAKAVDFPMQTFEGTKNFLPQALAAWERRGEAEEARREADARIDEQRRREREEQERRQWLADRRTALPEETLAALKHRAEAALAADGVDRARLGYEVLVKLKVDELLEREELATDICVSQGHRDPAAVEVLGVPGNESGMNRSCLKR